MKIFKRKKEKKNKKRGGRFEGEGEAIEQSSVLPTALGGGEGGVETENKAFLFKIFFDVSLILLTLF